MTASSNITLKELQKRTQAVCQDLISRLCEKSDPVLVGEIQRELEWDGDRPRLLILNSHLQETILETLKELYGEDLVEVLQKVVLISCKAKGDNSLKEAIPFLESVSVTVEFDEHLAIGRHLEYIALDPSWVMERTLSELEQVYERITATENLVRDELVISQLEQKLQEVKDRLDVTLEKSKTLGELPQGAYKPDLRFTDLHRKLKNL